MVGRVDDKEFKHKFLFNASIIGNSQCISLIDCVSFTHEGRMFKTNCNLTSLFILLTPFFSHNIYSTLNFQFF